MAGCAPALEPGLLPDRREPRHPAAVDAGVIDRSAGIVCDAKSGVSGAGRKPTLKTSFCEVTENFSAYSILAHRHVPEVLQTSGLEEREFSFTAQLLPLDRGILETIYFRTAASAEELLGVYEHVTRASRSSACTILRTLPDLHAVAHTNFCDLGVHVDQRTGRAVVVARSTICSKGPPDRPFRI